MKKVLVKVILFTVVIVGAVLIGPKVEEKKQNSLLIGGVISTGAKGIDTDDSLQSYYTGLSNNSEEFSRFFRPSSSKVLTQRYSYQEFESGQLPIFHKPEEVVYAYYGILEEASYLENYSLGCGTVGYATAPYKIAYELFSQEKKEELSYESFLRSNDGIGHISMLHFNNISSKEKQQFFVELEVIRGNMGEEPQGFFAYYYVVVTVVGDTKKGYFIDSIKMYPENWLCAPYHGWQYDATAVIQIVFEDEMTIYDVQMITSEEGTFQHYFVLWKGKKYEFVFVRLANGYDLLLHQYERNDTNKQEVNLFGEKWASLLLPRD